MTSIDIIKNYHAHVYYRTDDERASASVLRDTIDRGFEVELGRWRDQPVGPHPTPMYQVTFAKKLFSEIVPWLMLNRQGLAVLVHPNSDDAVADHRDYALWLGERLELDIAFLQQLGTVS